MPRRGGPRKPSDMPADAWPVVLRRTVAEFRRRHLGDSAAALTYWATLSLFPALLVILSVLGVVGSAATQRILDNLRAFAPGAARDILNGAVTQLQAGRGTGSAFLVLGLGGRSGRPPATSAPSCAPPTSFTTSPSDVPCGRPSPCASP